MMSFGYDPQLSEGALKCPIFQTSTFVFKSAEDGRLSSSSPMACAKQRPGEVLGLIYSRLNNPDLEILEDRLTLWDEADSAAVFESGMAAITTSLLAFVRPGMCCCTASRSTGAPTTSSAMSCRTFKSTPWVSPPERCPTSRSPASGNASAGRRVSACILETPANPTNCLVDIAGRRRPAGPRLAGTGGAGRP